MEIIIKSESVLLSGHIPSYLFIFLVNFWLYHFFQNFDVFHGSGSFEWIQIDVFSCPGDPGTIPDWFWIDLEKLIFSWRFSKFWVIWWGSFLKTHMYIHNLVNLRVPRPQATQNAKTKWNLSDSTERMLRKTKNKIEKGSKSGAEDISKIQYPR